MNILEYLDNRIDDAFDFLFDIRWRKIGIAICFTLLLPLILILAFIGIIVDMRKAP